MEILTKEEHSLHRYIFRWRTMQGELLTLDEMDTKHIFNAMKMLFNHLANEYGRDTHWFTKQYNDYANVKTKTQPLQIAFNIILFVDEIEKRGDLPHKYADVYSKIKSTLEEWNKDKMLTNNP